MRPENIRKLYEPRKNAISQRLNDFRKVWSNGTDEDILAELAFCLFTPQSKAKSCWAAVCRLKANGLVCKGSPKQISCKLDGVRFHNNKSKYLASARKLFSKNGKLCLKKTISSFDDTLECREWLVKNVKGLGYKEASHFLRNIGFGEKVAIIDRHILTNLKRYGVIKEIPKTITKQKYLEIEKKTADFARKTGIPLTHLDLLFWSNETGEVFK